MHRCVEVMRSDCSSSNGVYLRTASCAEGNEVVETASVSMDADAAVRDPAVDWVDGLVGWANGDYGECTRGGGGYKKFREAVVQFGVTPAKSWKDCIANLKQFGRETNINEVLGNGEGEYVPPHILGIQAMKKACKRYKIKYSASTRDKAVAAVLAEQLFELQLSPIRRNAKCENSVPAWVLPRSAWVVEEQTHH